VAALTSTASECNKK